MMVLYSYYLNEERFRNWYLNETVTEIRGFPKIDHSGIGVRIVFKKNKFSKKATSNRDRTLDPSTVVLTSCVQSWCFTNCANPHCLKDWDLKDPYIIMLYRFQLNPLSSKTPKVNWCTNKSCVKDPSINTCPDSSVGKAWDCTQEVRTTVLGSRVLSQLEVTFFAEFYLVLIQFWHRC